MNLLLNELTAAFLVTLLLEYLSKCTIRVTVMLEYLSIDGCLLFYDSLIFNSILLPFGKRY